MNCRKKCQEQNLQVFRHHVQKIFYPKSVEGNHIVSTEQKLIARTSPLNLLMLLRNQKCFFFSQTVSETFHVTFWI